MSAGSPPKRANNVLAASFPTPLRTSWYHITIAARRTRRGMDHEASDLDEVSMPQHKDNKSIAIMPNIGKAQFAAARSRTGSRSSPSRALFFVSCIAIPERFVAGQASLARQSNAAHVERT